MSLSPDTPPPPSPPSPHQPTPSTDEATVYKFDERVGLGLRFVAPSDEREMGKPQSLRAALPCIIESVAPGSISATILNPGDRIVSINGDASTTHDPVTAATTLRELSGHIRIEIERGPLPPPRRAQLVPPANAADDAADAADDDDGSCSDDGTMQPTGTHSSPESAPMGAPPSPATPTSVMGFHLNLPSKAASTKDPTVFGNAGHTRLGDAGSARALLKQRKASGASSPRDGTRPLSARFRQFAALLTPRGMTA